MAMRIYKVQIFISGYMETIIKANDNETDINIAAQARTANIERHLSEKLSTSLDISYDIMDIEEVDIIEGDEDVKSKKP